MGVEAKPSFGDVEAWLHVVFCNIIIPAIMSAQKVYSQVFCPLLYGTLTV